MVVTCEKHDTWYKTNGVALSCKRWLDVCMLSCKVFKYNVWLRISAAVGIWV